MKTTMTTPHPIEEAKKHTSAISIVETPQELEEQIKFIKVHFGAALPVESANKESITAKLAALKQKKNDRVITDLFPNARIFHPEEPLKWRDRDKDGMPVLAPFATDSPTCTFSHRRDMTPHFASIAPLYADVTRKMRRKTGTLCEYGFWLIPILCGVLGAQMIPAPGDNIVVATIISETTIAFWGCMVLGVLLAGFLFGNAQNDRIYYVARHLVAQVTFQGLIPNPARVVILKAQEVQKSGLFKEVCLLAEVSKWNIALEPKPVPTRKVDPLIIAFDGEKHWLLDSFNVTPVEMMAAGYTDTPSQS